LRRKGGGTISFSGEKTTNGKTLTTFSSSSVLPRPYVTTFIFHFIRLKKKQKNFIFSFQILILLQVVGNRRRG
jgi:hypothetical protein